MVAAGAGMASWWPIHVLDEAGESRRKTKMEEKTHKAKQKCALEALHFPSLTVPCRLTHTLPIRPCVCCPTLNTNTLGVFTVSGLLYQSAFAVLTNRKQERKTHPETWKTERLPVTSKKYHRTDDDMSAAAYQQQDQKLDRQSSVWVYRFVFMLLVCYVGSVLIFGFTTDTRSRLLSERPPVQTVTQHPSSPDFLLCHHQWQ